MPAAPHATPAQWNAAGAALLLGTALQLQQPALWSAPQYAGLAGVAGLVLAALAASAQRCALPALPLRPAFAALALRCTAIAALAFALTGLRAGWRLADALDPALEGRDLVAVGVVAGLPQQAPEAWRFRFEVESARLADVPVTLPRRLALGWYAQGGAAPPAVLRPGQRWQFTVRLKRPHGARNPHGFDYELWLFEQGVRATGYVRANGPARLLADDAGGHAVDRLRQRVRDAIAARLGEGAAARGSAAGEGGAADAARRREAGALSFDGSSDREAGTPTALDGSRDREAGVLAALAVGDQAAIDGFGQ